MNIYQGNPDPPRRADLRSSFRGSTSRSPRGCWTGRRKRLLDHGVPEEDIDVVWVPGAFEIPLVAGEMADSEQYDAVICLGAVVRGETTHDQHINRAVSNALAETRHG